MWRKVADLGGFPERKTHTRGIPSRRVRSLSIVGASIAVAAGLALPGQPLSAAGWGGFSVAQLPSVVSGGDAPAWGLALTNDLGGPGADVWNNNHGLLSEAITDLGLPNQDVTTAIDAGDPTVVGPDSHGVLFTDIDGDGDEDLLEVNGRNNNNRIFRNNGGSLSPVSYTHSDAADE